MNLLLNAETCATIPGYARLYLVAFRSVDVSSARKQARQFHTDPACRNCAYCLQPSAGFA